HTTLLRSGRTGSSAAPGRAPHHRCANGIVHAAHSACDRTTVRSAGVVRGNWRLPGEFEVFLAVHLLQHREATSCADEGEGGGPDAEPPPRQLGTGVRALSGRGRGRGLARDGTGGTGT